MTAKQILENVLNENAALLNDSRPLYESNGLLNDLAHESGRHSEKNVGNDWNVWSSPISKVARMLCESLAQDRAEEAGLGPFEDSDQFLAACQ